MILGAHPRAPRNATQRLLRAYVAATPPRLRGKPVLHDAYCRLWAEIYLKLKGARVWRY